MGNERVELILNNVTFGVLNRINASLSNYLKIDDYVYKKNTHSIIINNIEVLEEAKKIINSVDEKIVITEKVLKNIYRYIFYLENLDCANCGAKVERLCTKNIIADKVVVDFPTLKIIIETTKDYDEKELQLLIQECAEMVDPRIEVKKSLNKKVTEEFKIDPKKKKVFIIGLVIFLVFFIAKTIIKYVFNIDELWVVIMIYIGYLPAYFLLSKEILLGALKNLKNARFFDEMFLMTLATIMALVVQYYDEAIFIIIFYRIGELCQQYAINYSRKSIAELTKIKVEKAMVEINGQKVEMDAEGIVVGDILYINSGERIALDGVVEEGTALLDNKALTGESIPVEVKAGTEVVSGAICLDGTIKVKVTKTYENSMVAKILGVVENASLSKSKSETLISKFAKYYTPFIVMLAFIIAIFLPLINNSVYPLSWAGYKQSIRIAMIFLVVSCPCALVLSIPLSFFGGIGSASKNGILIKGSNYLEALNDVDTVIFDKTGTLTKGNFALKEVKSVSNYTDEEVLMYAAYAESTSNHVIAQSIINSYAKKIDLSNISPLNINDKRGIAVSVNGKIVKIGRKMFMEGQKIKVTNEHETSNALFVAIDDVLAGYIRIEDEIREDSISVIKKLKKLGIKKTIMITGDSEKVAQDVSQKIGLDAYYADITPIEKVNILNKLKQENRDKKIAYIGDGINDAPVISSADIGIALGGFGSEATAQIADVVLIENDIKKLPKAFMIAKKTRIIVIENIVIALFVKILFLSLAMLNIINNILIYAAIFADVGVSLIAIINSLRILKYGENKWDY